MKEVSVSNRLRLAAGALLGLALCPALVAWSAPKAGDQELTVLSTASNRGEVDHCGCHKAPKGGLTRRMAYVDSMRSKSGPLLLVDAGDYSDPTATGSGEENWFILRAMGRMHYDAMTLGELELYRGTDYVQSILDSTQVPVTLANAKFTKTKAPVGKEFLLSKVDGVTYGIIGLVGKDFGEGADKFTTAGFTVEDPFDTAARLVPVVKKQADLVVVLAHLGSADALQLPKAVPGIDVVVFGHYPGITAATQVEGAVTVRPGQRGMYIGETRLVVNPEHKIVSFTGESVPLDKDKIREDPTMLADLRGLMKSLGKNLHDDAPVAANTTPAKAAAGADPAKEQTQ
jgi:2',3'-cyclic-nucleotide 2'-phosphodiesterase (5'-nucleotidase family)